MSIRRVLAAALVPLILAGLFVLGGKAWGLMRYDPAYFTERYVERYDTPGAVTRALETALRNDDQALLAELQGMQRPAAFKTGPNMMFVMLWEQGDRYFTYLYSDAQTFERFPHYVEQVKGRWVVTPTGAYYYLHSGRWLRVFLPLAIVWWLVEAVVVLALWLYRVSACLRERMYSEES